MKVLLDTCTFLWVIWDSPKLSQEARRVFADQDNDIFLSVVSGWEIAVKHKLGKLPLPEDPARLVPAQRRAHQIATLELDEESALRLPSLPDLHRDPFDRMLICQAISGSMSILTPDESVRAYPVRTVW